MDTIKGDILAHARPAHKGLLQKRLEEGLYRIISHTAPPLPPPQDPIGQGTELNAVLIRLCVL